MRAFLALVVAIPLAIHARPAAACDDDDDVQLDVNIDIDVDVDAMPSTLLDESVDELEIRLETNDQALRVLDDRDDDDRDDDDRDD